jgi:hypothetical protein
MLNLARPSIPEHYTNIAIVFAISGILHLIMDLSMGIKAYESDAFMYFFSFAFGIMIEDAAQAA